MNQPDPPAASPDVAGDNPFFQEWTGPFGAPPFGRIVPAHFLPAFDRAFAAHDAEVAAVAADPAVPGFDNTIAALELSGRLLRRGSGRVRALAGAPPQPAPFRVQRGNAPPPAPPLG